MKSVVLIIPVIFVLKTRDIEYVNTMIIPQTYTIPTSNTWQ